MHIIHERFGIFLDELDSDPSALEEKEVSICC